MTKETEVFGVTYDRYVLLQLHRIFTRQLALKNVVEMPSHGAKAAGSLYSIGFGLAGCHVTLVNPEMEMMVGWEELGINNRVETASDIDVFNSGFENNQFDEAEKELEKLQNYSQSEKLTTLWQIKSSKDPQEIRKQIEAWQKILSKYPDYRDGWLELALLWTKLKEVKKAKQAIQKAATLSPNYPLTKELEKIL